MILLDTHAWVRWLHPELGQPLPKPLQEQNAVLVTTDEHIHKYPDLRTVWNYQDQPYGEKDSS